MTLPTAHSLVDAHGDDPSVTLDFAGRFLRRKRLIDETGRAFLVDLPQTLSVDEGKAFALSDGTRVAIRAKPEALMHVTGDDMVRLAWHIGNRHAPCEITVEGLFVQADPVMARMLAGLGATVTEVKRPFHPEGGAYGHGRTHGHSHGHSHGPSHEPADGGHGHSHG